MEDAYEIREGDCREVMRGMDAESIDAIVCDPPYGLSFMGKGWDHGVPGVEFWTEAMRVAKPGAHLLAFGGTRTYHRLACAIEDAGWEIRDCVMWVYGSGFPKSHDVSKAIDKAAGAKREIVGSKLGQPGYSLANHKGREVYAGDWIDPVAECTITAPATDAARQWSGWGTALKPAWEPIIVARKPLVGTVAESVIAHGTGAINVDASRIPVAPDDPVNFAIWHSKPNTIYGKYADKVDGVTKPTAPPRGGRWPANVMHDGSEEVVGLFPAQRKSSGGAAFSKAGYDGGWCPPDDAAREIGYGDSGSAARFFYCAKASKADRGDGNNHPTVKPTALMRYLCRLVTQPGGIVLDPFCGSGSTGKAALLEGFRFIGIERESDYAAIARARIAAVKSRHE